jgi:hypothetical protein
VRESISNRSKHYRKNSPKLMAMHKITSVISFNIFGLKVSMISLDFSIADLILGLADLETSQSFKIKELK